MRPLLSDEIRATVDCLHLSHEEVTRLGQSPSSNGRELVYEAHPLTKVGPISKLVPLSEAKMRRVLQVVLQVILKVSLKVIQSFFSRKLASAS